MKLKYYNIYKSEDKTVENTIIYFDTILNQFFFVIIVKGKQLQNIRHKIQYEQFPHIHDNHINKPSIQYMSHGR